MGATEVRRICLVGGERGDAYTRGMVEPADDSMSLPTGGNSDLTDRDLAAFDALNAYAETGAASDPSFNPLFRCLDRLAALGPDDGAAGGDPLDSSSHIGLPTRLGDYEIGACLGRGGMGAVYRGRHVKMGHEVAIKVIAGDTAGSPEVVERFYQEARAAAGEEHPNVVAVRHVEQEAGLHYLVMDLVDGPTLSERLLDGPMDWKQAANLMVRVADALQHLHDRGVVHRDLKPSNILLDCHGRPYVTDFGLAKLVNAVGKTQSRALVGTPRYMSPEQASGRAKDVGPESDVFALGAILYECLTGRPAFDAEHPLDAVLQVIETEPRPIRASQRDVPRDLERIVVRCMEKDRDSRYATAREVVNDLKACLAGEPLAASRTTAPAFLRRAFRRRPAVALRILGVGAIALIVQASHWFAETVSLKTAVVPASTQEHMAVMSVLFGWLGASIALHVIWRKIEGDRWVPYMWAVIDVVFLTWVLMISRDALNAPAVGYPCLIAVAGVWLKQPVVWFTSLAAAAGYLSLHLAVVPALPHYPIIFLSGLALVALATSYQVQRVRWLTAVAETGNAVRAH